MTTVPPKRDVESENQPDVVGDVGQSKTIELLLDVELPVSVSFGRTHLPLRDVLKLTSGSIVELNAGGVGTGRSYCEQLRHCPWRGGSSRWQLRSPHLSDHQPPESGSGL